ncbi:MAG: T9SS type A sorting domain-containing protein [Myroides sp.]
MVHALRRDLATAQVYDIIYVDWDNGIGDIKQNAETLKKIIKYVNDQKALNGSTEPNILLGQSMGGLIGKYALVKLEDEGYTHQVKLFATHDSPLRGSNTPVGIQAMGRHVLEMYVGNPFASMMGEVVLPLFQDLMQLFGADFMDNFSTPADNLTLMDAPAAVQMNNYYVAPNYDITADYHNIWQAEFDALGYPEQDNIRNIAISNGNMCAANQGYGPGAHLLKFTKQTDQNEFKSVLRDMGMTFWGATSHMPNLVIASQIPGESRLRIDFQIRVLPLTTATDREVYRGILKYDKIIYVLDRLRPWKKKKIGTITVDMYDKKVSAPNDCLPTEHVAGGKENLAKNIPDMLDDLTNVSKYVVNQTFSFVPVASALDIRRSNGNLTLQDYGRRYSTTNLNSLDPNLSSPFDNFMAESRGLNKHNYLDDNFSHINFSLKSAGFLATEMNAITNSGIIVPDTNCTLLCNLNGITGTSSICRNIQYQYSIPNVGDHQIIWDVPQGLIVEENPLEPWKIKVTIDPNSSIGGTQEIRVLVRTVSCGEFRVSKTVNIGMQAPDGIYGPTHWSVSSNPNMNFPPAIRTYSVDPVPGATSYEWTVTGGFIDVNHESNFSNYPTKWEILTTTKNTSEITVKPSGPGALGVRACNDCGCSNYVYLNIQTQNLDDYFQQYPNPADDHIILALKEGVTPPSFQNDRTNVLVYDMQGRKKKEFTISSRGGETNVSDLPVGIYKMLINLQNENHQVITLQISR